MYVTASKDGSVRIWDGVTAECVRSIVGAHGSAEATCVSFTKDQRQVLTRKCWLAWWMCACYAVFSLLAKVIGFAII